MSDYLDSATEIHPPLRAEIQAALNLIPAFAWYCNASGGLTFLNERGSDYLGLPKDHPIRHGIDTGAEWDSHISLLHPDDHEEARRVWSTCLRTGCAGQVSFRVRNAEGGYRWHLSRSEPVRASDETLLYWIGVNLDIEDRKQAELYLAEGQRLAHTGSWAFNAAGFDYWSPELFRIYGLDPSGKAPTLDEYMALVHPDDLEFVSETIQKMFAERRGFDFTKRIVRPDGEIRRVRCVGNPATHAGAVEEFVGTGIDVTEHELLTQELGRREAYLAEAQRLSHTGSFGWKPDTGEIIWSAETYRIFEYDPAVTPTIDLVAQRVHPEDRADFQSVIERASGGAPDLDHAYRLLLPDGRSKHVHALAHATQDASGNREFVGAVSDITDQRRAEGSLRASESYLAEAQKLSHTGSWAWSPKKGIRYWSEETYRVLGFDPRDGLPRFEELFQRIHPDDQVEFYEVTQRAIRENVDVETEYRIVHPSGALRDIHSTGHPVLSASGDLIELIGTVIDVTERKRAEEELRRSEAYLADAQKVSQTGSWAWSPEVGIKYWSEECYRVQGFDPQDGLPRFEELFERMHPDDQPKVKELIQRVVREKVEFATDYRLVHPDGAVRDIHTTAHPVFSPTGELIEFMGTVIDVTDRKRAEQDLRRSEAYLAGAQRLSHTGSFGWKPDTGEIIWSAETYSIFEYDRAIAPTIDLVAQRAHPEDRADVQSVIERASRGASDFEHAYRLLLPDGRVKHVHALAHATQDASGNREFVGAVTDFTDQRRAEESLRESESYLAEAQKLSHTGSWAWNPDPNEDIRYWSDECYRVLGFDPAGLIPLFEEFFQKIHPDDQAVSRERFEKAIRDKADFEMDYRIVHPDKGVRDIHVVGSAILDRSGDLHEFVGTVIDITERKRAEEKLRRSEAYLAEAQRLSQTGSWAWSPDEDITYWSEECYRVLGFDPRNGPPRFEEFFQRIHPDDQVGFLEHNRRTIRERLDAEREYRIVHPGGDVRDIETTYHPVFSPSGDLIEFVGTVIDVTEQRQARAELEKALEEIKKSEDRLRVIIDTIPTMAWTDRPDGSAEFLSRGWLDYTGLSLEEALNWGWTVVLHPEDSAALTDKWLTAVATGEPFEAEARFRRADGKYRWCLCRGVPLRDETGNIIQWHGTTTDIEDRKRAEQELRTSERKYRHLVDTTPAFVNTALPNGEVDFFNHGWAEYAGLDFTEMLGWRWTAAFHPEDVESFVGKWRAAIESGEPLVAEARVRRADGEYRWFLQRSEPLRNEAGEIVKWYGSGIEIEERKVAEEKIRAQETELRQMLDFTPQQVAVFGPGGERLYANRVALDYVGVSLEEWLQTPGGFFRPGSFIHPDDRERTARAYSDGSRSGGSAYELELRVQGADGSYRWFLVRYNPVRDEHGQIMRWYVASTDIEDRKRAEEEIRKENIALREEIIKTSMFEEIVGNSPALQQVIIRVAKVAPTDSTVLITGETGTGKELIARAIHKASKRSDRAFISVNCAAIPPSLIPSELFGHEKGAFTGATQRRLGRFELAEGGTIFLDEVGELPPETQVALLRVLQEREFERVGGNRSIRANVRVIVATNRDLPDAIAAGTFREDLFYRLNVFPIEIPPLRERREDIPMLVQYFIDRYARKEGKNIGRASRETLDMFQRYPWPGNIRELQNVIERSVIVSGNETFAVDESWLSRQPMPKSNQFELRETLNAREREAIEAALTESRGRVFGPTGAAARLGIARSTLESKIRTLKIDKNRFKASILKE